MPDLTLTQPAEMFTVRVHNYQDDPAHDAISLHGLFTNRDEAERLARAVSLAWDFITADVHPIRLSTIEQIAAAQNISHIAHDLPADTGDGAEVAAERDPVADATALAPVVHEADWTMAGPRWPWHQATAQQRQDAFIIAQAAIANPTMADAALEALVARLWTLKPKHGAPRRVEAKAAKIRQWLITEGLRERGQ